MPVDDFRNIAVGVVELAAAAADRGAGGACLCFNLGIAAAGNQQIEKLETLFDGLQFMGRADVFEETAAFIHILQFQNGFVKGFAAAVCQYCGGCAEYRAELRADLRTFRLQRHGS